MSSTAWSWTAWNPAPVVLIGAATALMLFGRAWVRLRRRRRAGHASWPRAVLFLTAVVIGVLSLISPLDAAADTSLTAHMLQHVMIGEAAPALALLALRGPLLFFFMPAAVLRRLGRSARLRDALAAVLRPRISLAAWALVLAAWHVPAAYDYALRHPIAHDLEHISFFAVGVLVWTQLVDPAHRRTLRRSERLGCAVAMVAFTAALGVLLLFSNPLFPAYAHPDARLFALSPSLDQHLAGLVMLAGQLAVLALCVCFSFPAATQRRSVGRQEPLPESGRAPFRTRMPVSLVAMRQLTHASAATTGVGGAVRRLIKPTPL